MPGVLGPPTLSKSRGPVTIRALTDKALSSAVPHWEGGGPQDEKRVVDRACLPSRGDPVQKHWPVLRHLGLVNYILQHFLMSFPFKQKYRLLNRRYRAHMWPFPFVVVVVVLSLSHI